MRPSQASISARVRSQRRPLISSSYSSASRRRARNSVLSTIGRDISSRCADLVVGKTLELAEDEDPVVELGDAAERAAQVLELLLALDDDVGTGIPRDQIVLAVGPFALPLERNLEAGACVRRSSSMHAFLAIW